MKLEPMAEYYAKMIWRTSDTPGFKLFWLTQKYDEYSAMNTLMKEYIYLKAGIVARLIYLSSEKANEADANLILMTVEKKLKMLYNAGPNEKQYTWGSNYNELIERVNDYMATLPSEDLSAVRSSFVAHLSAQRAEYGKLIEHIGPLGFVKYVENYMLNKMVKYENSQSENGRPTNMDGDDKIEEELMANVVADAIWATEDYGGNYLVKIGKEPAAIMVMKDILKEYMYLKAGIAHGIIYKATANEQEYNTIMGKAMGILQNVYSTAPHASYGGTFNELVERVNEYWEAEDLNEVAYLFSKHLYRPITLFGGSERLVDKMSSPQFLKSLEKYMRGNFYQFQKNNIGYNNSGKSDDIGCLYVVIWGLVIFIIFTLAIIFKVGWDMT